MPPEGFKSDSVFDIDRRLSAPFRRVSQKSVLLAAVIAAPDVRFSRCETSDQMKAFGYAPPFMRRPAPLPWIPSDRLCGRIANLPQERLSNLLAGLRPSSRHWPRLRPDLLSRAAIDTFALGPRAAACSHCPNSLIISSAVASYVTPQSYSRAEATNSRRLDFQSPRRIIAGCRQMTFQFEVLKSRSRGAGGLIETYD